jgi:GT2 family glycosyltransferase
MARSIVVLIATHKRTDLLERTLASLARCELPASYRETVVVENGGRFGADLVVAEGDPKLRARYVFVEQGNKSLALNAALETIDADPLIVFTDDDVRFRSDFLRVYDQAIQRFDRGWMFGGTVEIDYEGEPPPDWLRLRLPASVTGFKLADKETEYHKDVLGANFAAFGEDLRDAGGFSPRRGPGTASTGQETDMQHRLLARGVRGLFLPDAVVWHYVPSDRSTPQWALERADRKGFAEGVQLAVGRKGRRAPMVIWFDLFKRAVFSVIGRLLPSKAKQFGVRFQWRRAVARLRGFRSVVTDRGDSK